MAKLNGYLDHLRENLEVLDEAIATARTMSKARKRDKESRAYALQWAKTLRDLVELRNQTLDRVKGHLLGRNETGAITEPENVWDKNPQVMFERYFRSQLSPWTEQDLKLTCEDCGVESENVMARGIWRQDEQGYKSGDTADLCPECYEKRPDKRED